MSFLPPTNEGPLHAEAVHQREQELRARAERFSATHPDGASEPSRTERLLYRVRALLSRRTDG